LSHSLSKELLDLVNDNYQNFLSLGSTLRGGEERIEEVRVGLLGFQRDLTSVRDNVDQRRYKVAGWIEEKRKLIREIQNGKLLLEISEQIEDLEAALMLHSTNGDVDGTDGDQDLPDESDEDTEYGGISMRCLERHVDQYSVLKLLIGRQSPQHPFILSQANRIDHIKSVLALDLEGALKHLRTVQKDDSGAAITERAKKLLGWVREDS
jgi:conserved oligomeric Golgi complex subunit 2